MSHSNAHDVDQEQCHGRGWRLLVVSILTELTQYLTPTYDFRRRFIARPDQYVYLPLGGIERALPSTTTTDASYDRGSSFPLTWFPNDGVP